MKNAIAPKKRFSQNFLTDGRTAARIASHLEAGSKDAVLEIGPGTGALTEHLVAGPAGRIVAVELDPRSIDALQGMVKAANGRLSIIKGSILDVDPERVFPDSDPEHRLVIGNIPYAITSEILFWIFEHRHTIGRAVIMMQKEVARRCVAVPGSKEYGILSVASWYASSSRLVMTVQPGSFFPRPKVTSAVVRFDLRKHSPTEVAFGPFMEFVRAAFGQRRKVMSNALRSWAESSGYSITGTYCGVDLSSTRAEQLNPEALADIFAELMRKQALEGR